MKIYGKKKRNPIDSQRTNYTLLIFLNQYSNDSNAPKSGAKPCPSRMRRAVRQRGTGNGCRKGSDAGRLFVFVRKSPESEYSGLLSVMGDCPIFMTKDFLTEIRYAWYGSEEVPLQAIQPCKSADFPQLQKQWLPLRTSGTSSAFR